MVVGQVIASNIGFDRCTSRKDAIFLAVHYLVLPDDHLSTGTSLIADDLNAILNTVLDGVHVDHRLVTEALDTLRRHHHAILDDVGIHIRACSDCSTLAINK